MGSNIFLVGGAVVFLAVFLRYFSLYFSLYISGISRVFSPSISLSKLFYFLAVALYFLPDSCTVHMH